MRSRTHGRGVSTGWGRGVSGSVVGAVAASAVAALAMVGCSAADGTGGENPSTGGNAASDFGQGSPRPDCLETPGPNRVAYYPAPVVVASDWSEPIAVSPPVTDACPNDAITISDDGLTLYFFWSPVVEGSNAELLAPETGTYRAERVGDDLGVFGEPTYVDLQKGTENGSDDGSLNFTPGGESVIFHSTRAANLGYLASPPTDDYLDLYVADIVDGVPGPAANLGEPVNTVYLDGEAGLSPDGSRLYVASNRPGGLGGTDLWVSEHVGTGWGAGSWSDPVNMGAPIDSASEDLQPAFAANDPNTMYFTSDRDGPTSIYRSTWDGTSWSAPEMVITGYAGEPTLVADGSVMYFVQVWVDDAGVFGSNIWYVTRTA
jgi:hypothetical protein